MYDLLAVTAESNFNGASYPLDVVHHVVLAGAGWVPRSAALEEGSGSLAAMLGLEPG